MVVTAFTARVTSAAASGDVPNDMPPVAHVGARDVHLDQPHLLLAVDALAAIGVLLDRGSPEMLAITGLRKKRFSRGSSSAITASMPGFCKPHGVDHARRYSAMRGVGLPKRGSRVVPLNENEPRMLMS